MANQSQQKPHKEFVPPVFLVNTAFRLRRFFLKAADAVVPSYMALFDRFMGATTTALVDAAARLHIADHLKDGPLDAEALAKKTNSSLDILERTLRALVSVGVFRRLSDGRYANNHTSSGMITGSKDNARGFVEFFGTDALVRAWAQLPEKLQGKGGNAFQDVNGKHIWDWLSDKPQVQAAFAEGMSSMTQVVAPAIAEAYPFHEVKTVCDVGGGVGIVLAAALKRHPHLQGVLFDSASMLGEAESYLKTNGIADRVKRVAGSFFESIPRGADAYVLKTVLHNWEDHDALKILRNCRAAMDPGHKLLVSDFLDAPDTLSTLVPYMDIAGMMVFSGRERTPEKMSKLFDQTGFKLGRVLPRPGCQAIFEGVAVA